MHDHCRLAHMEMTCGSLLSELQRIWDDIGEVDTEKDKMLVALEQECLEVYRRKVDEAKKGRAQLCQAIADSKAEVKRICSALGEQLVNVRQNAGESLKDELKTILPRLEELQKRKLERRKQFVDVLDKIQSISNEINGSVESDRLKMFVDEADMSVKKLEELRGWLHQLQNEKGRRLKLVLDSMNTLNSLCAVLGMDFKPLMMEIHPSLDDSEGTKSISNDTIDRLACAMENLREVKMQRLNKLQDIATSMLEIWSLMDTPIEEQEMFHNATSLIAASEHEVTETNILSLSNIEHVDAELSRLEKLKSGKTKELILKKRSELEEICRKAHMVPDAHCLAEDSVGDVVSGALDPAYILEQIELEIVMAKDEAQSRKEILEKVQKWLAACEEESWLEEYNRDENRYNAGRGTHFTLKHAEKARALVNKIPAIMEALTLKATAWEKERGVEFLYNGVRLLSMIEQYSILKHEKETERQRQRDQRKLHGQLMAEQEALFGSKPSPTNSGKKVPGQSFGGAGNRRVSLGGAMLQTMKTERTLLGSRYPKRNNFLNQKNSVNHEQCGSLPNLSSGKKNLDAVGKPVKKKSSIAAHHVHYSEPPVARKPLSPVSSSLSSKANITNLLEDQRAQSRTPEGNSFSTPPKLATKGEENKTTPKTRPIPAPAPATPSTLSYPMQIAGTPVTPSVPLGSKLARDGPEILDYSVEEMRAGFVHQFRKLLSNSG